MKNSAAQEEPEQTLNFSRAAFEIVALGASAGGVMGVQAIKEMGGTVIAQNQESSEFFGMPNSAIRTGSVDFILPLSDIASALISLVIPETSET